jgi:CRISPR-associated protein Cas2
MAAAEMLMVFCYDVADDRRRRKVAAILEERLVRVQESVFEGRLAPAETERLVAAAGRVLGAEDSLRVYAVSADGLARCRRLGGAPFAEDTEFWLL